MGLKGFDQFCNEQRHWLNDFALFVVLKRNFTNACWADWPIVFRDRQDEALKEFLKQNEEPIKREKFFQFVFYRQWMRLQGYCSLKGIGLIGDIPIYVNYDSVDVWINPSLFKLDAAKRPVSVAGVPPDYFSAEGQRWGNPVYDWDRLKATNFAWWISRLKHNLMLFDAARIDHFRAFAQCWEIPSSEKTAKNGKWSDVPGEELFTAVTQALPNMSIIAEDLGIITPDVDALKNKFQFPGMGVTLFAFHEGYKESRNLPANFKPLSVGYTGTHDNNTIRGWYEHDITDTERENLLEYFGEIFSVDVIHWVLIELTLKSKASLVILPLQDILGLGKEARMNTPSTVKNNWKWRFRSGSLSKGVVERLQRLTVNSER